MSVRVLQAADLSTLDGTCADCPLGPELSPEANWALEADRVWGCCGVAISRDGRTVAYALISPALNVPKGHPAATGPLAPDSAVLVAVRVVPEARSAGIGRELIQHLAARTYGRHGTAAIEAVGSWTASSCETPPASWLLAVGFHPLDMIPMRPRYRLELATAVPWLDLKAAWRRVVAWVPRPVGRPEPVSRGVPRQTL